VDREDHQCLGGQRLDEPSGTEPRGASLEDQSMTAKVPKSNTELSGPKENMNLRMNPMSQWGLNEVVKAIFSMRLGLEAAPD